MVNVNAQEYIDKKYPINGTCQRKEDKENLNKKRKEITILDISKGKVGKNSLFGEEKTLIGSLKLEGFTKLRKLIISSHQITELNVSECSKLEELDFGNNQLDSLNITGCSNLYKINCFNNNLKELDLSTCAKVEEVNINNCPELTTDTIKSDLNYNAVSRKLTKVGPQITKVGENDIRNILIVGITGNGKSALANTLSDSDKFAEGSHSTSITKNFKKSKLFEWQGKKYCIIDNIGFGDTASITEEDILHEIGKGIYSAKEGLNQILFVFKDRFSEEQAIVFNMFKDFIAESEITEITTLVRTNFPNFRNQQKCEDDRKNLINESNKNFSEIISSCKGIVYVDNPAIPTMEEGDDEETIEEKEKQAQINEEKRKTSRKVVLDHLVKDCQVIYKLKEWNGIHSMVEDYIKRKEEIKQNLGDTKEGQKKLEEVKKSWFKELRVKIGASLPMLAAEFNAQVEIIK